MSAPLRRAWPLLLSIGVFSSCPPPTAGGGLQAPTPPDGRPKIVTKHGSAVELETQRQLERIFDEYDLKPWLFTSTVEIDEDSIPHSHPVLTLHCRHRRDDLLLLSTYIHEQSHHFCQQQREKIAGAISEVEALYPSMPVGYPDGADSMDSTYEHLTCVIPLEYAGLRARVGELSAMQAMEFWSHDHYRVLYRTFIEDRGGIMAALKKSGVALPK